MGGLAERGVASMYRGAETVKSLARAYQMPNTANFAQRMQQAIRQIDSIDRGELQR